MDLGCIRHHINTQRIWCIVCQCMAMCNFGARFLSSRFYYLFVLPGFVHFILSRYDCDPFISFSIILLLLIESLRISKFFYINAQKGAERWKRRRGFRLFLLFQYAFFHSSSIGFAVAEDRVVCWSCRLVSLYVLCATNNIIILFLFLLLLKQMENSLRLSHCTKWLIFLKRLCCVLFICVFIAVFVSFFSLFHCLSLEHSFQFLLTLFYKACISVFVCIQFILLHRFFVGALYGT